GSGNGKFFVAWNDEQNWRCGQYSACGWGQLVDASSAPTDPLPLKTPVDGGWTLEPTPISASVFAVARFAAGRRYAVGDTGMILHRDASSWTLLPLLTQTPFGAWATSNDDLWTSGWCGLVGLAHAGNRETSYCGRIDGNVETGINAAIWAANRSFIV